MYNTAKVLGIVWAMPDNPFPDAFIIGAGVVVVLGALFNLYRALTRRY